MYYLNKPTRRARYNFHNGREAQLRTQPTHFARAQASQEVHQARHLHRAQRVTHR